MLGEGRTEQGWVTSGFLTIDDDAEKVFLSSSTEGERGVVEIHHSSKVWGPLEMSLFLKENYFLSNKITSS